MYALRNVSSIAFAFFSACPSDCGWYAVYPGLYTQLRAQCQKSNVNLASRSDTKEVGKPRERTVTFGG